MASLDRTIDHPVYIIAPEKFIIWLEEYNNIQDVGLNRFIKVVPSYLLFRKFVDAYANYNEMLEYLNMSNIETVSVMHVRGACALVFDYKDCSLENSTTAKPIRLAYSGDCRPNREFIRAGMNADVLIHESTFESELEYEAVKKFHCTINEACTVGRCMRVKFLLLTHFSQRYPKVPLFPVFKSSDYNSNLLHSHIFDVLPTSPFAHYSSSSRCDFNRFSDNTEISTASSATSVTTSTTVSPSNSVSVLVPPTTNSQTVSIKVIQSDEKSPNEESKPKLLEPPKLKLPEQSKPKSRPHSPSISSQLQPLMFIPTEAGLSPFQLIPSAKETIAEIEKMMEDMPEDPNYQMKIGMAVDHFHLRVGYDEPCMEWITEAMRILIPDDEEDDDDDDDDDETTTEKRLEKLNRIRNKENYNKTNKGTAKRMEAKKEKYLTIKINDRNLSDSSKSIEITSAESESDTQNHDPPTPVDDLVQNKRIRF